MWLRIVIALTFSIALPLIASGQTIKGTQLESTLRKLDIEAAKAIQEKDEKGIARYFAASSVINNPRNGLTIGSQGIIESLRAGLINYFSFERQIESIQLLGDTAILMGSETIVMKGPGGGEGATTRRRYTNVWKKMGKSWQIVARQASVICE